VRTFDELARIRPIVLRLLHVWLEGPQRYEEGWSDEHLAAVLGADAGEVSFIRRAAFGPESEAGELWRIRQAVELLEEHFDDVARQGHRDALVAAEGLPALQAALRGGVAPAGGRYEGGWNDDRIAELTGLQPGLVTCLRATIPWVEPSARGERQRQRRAARLLRPTRAGRVLRLAEELNPATGKPYTPAEIADALVAAGEKLRTPAARAALEAWIESTVRVGQLRLAVNPRTGQPYTIEEIADRVGASKQAVSKILKRFDDEDAGPRSNGRPSQLGAVLERIAAADPRQVERRRFAAWLAEWLWPRARKSERASQARKIRAWRQAGVAAIEAGDVETLPAKFEAAVADLYQRAPAELAQDQKQTKRRKG
jgi:transposase